MGILFFFEICIFRIGRSDRVFPDTALFFRSLLPVIPDQASGLTEKDYLSELILRSFENAK
jgi:hypothetical protein